MRTRITAALVAVLALLTWLAAPALAARPSRLSGEIIDHSGALGDRRAEVQTAITGLYDNHRTKVYVVYVRSVSELRPATRAVAA